MKQNNIMARLTALAFTSKIKTAALTSYVFYHLYLTHQTLINC